MKGPIDVAACFEEAGGITNRVQCPTLNFPFSGFITLLHLVLPADRIIYRYWRKYQAVAMHELKIEITGRNAVNNYAEA